MVMMTIEQRDPLLSICIPTFNRGPFITELLDTIVRELASLPAELAQLGIEVAISDNASTDDTTARVAAFADRLTLSYVRQAENIGPDRNYLAAVEASHGRFCWLMGSDDVLEVGGLASVLQALTRWRVAGLSVNYVKRSFDLQVTSPVRPPVIYRDNVVVTGGEEIYKQFFAHFGFISAHVFRRDAWQHVVSTGEPLEFLNGYVHVLILGRIVQSDSNWGYVHAICVGWRGRNDSFVSGDHVDRMMVDIIGYRSITQRLFSQNNDVCNHVLDTLAGTHVLVHYRIAKVFFHSARTLRTANHRLIKEYWRYPAFWKKLLPWMLLPAPLLHGAWIAYQRTRHRLSPTFKIHPQAQRR